MKIRRKSWVLEATAEAGATLQDHVDALLAIVEPAASQFAQLACDACIILSCAIYDYSRDAVLGFNKASVEKLAAIGAHIDIDYYDMSHADEGITPEVQIR